MFERSIFIKNGVLVIEGNTTDLQSVEAGAVPAYSTSNSYKAIIGAKLYSR